MKLVLTTAEWCGPCKGVKEQISKNNYDVEIKDFDNDKEFFKDHGIKTVPTLLVFDGDNLVSKVNGTDAILNVIKENQVN